MALLPTLLVVLVRGTDEPKPAAAKEKAAPAGVLGVLRPGLAVLMLVTTPGAELSIRAAVASVASAVDLLPD